MGVKEASGVRDTSASLVEAFYYGHSVDDCSESLGDRIHLPERLQVANDE